MSDAVDPRTLRRFSAAADRLIVAIQAGTALQVKAAVTMVSAALPTTPPGHPATREALRGVWGAAWTTLERTGEVEVLRESLIAYRVILLVCRFSAPERAALLAIAVGARLLDYFNAHFDVPGAVAVLDEAIGVCRDAEREVSAADDIRPGVMATLGDALRIRYEHTEDVSALDEAITAHREGVALIPAGSSDSRERSARAMLLTGLGYDLDHRYERSQDAGVLNEAIAVHREAVAFLPPGEPDRAMQLDYLGMSLQRRHRVTGDAADLEEAIGAALEAVQTTPTDEPRWAGMLSNLSSTHHHRFELTGNVADLKEAIDLLRQAIRACGTDGPGRGLYLANLGSVLSTWFSHTGDASALSEAITAHREALAVTALADADRPHRLAGLGDALQLRSSRYDDVTALDEAIAAYREALLGIPAGDPIRVNYLNNLGSALENRFSAPGGENTHLEEAQQVLQEAVALLSEDHPDRSTVLSNLGSLLQTRHGLSASAAGREEARSSAFTRALAEETARAAIASPDLYRSAARAMLNAAPPSIAAAATISVLGGPTTTTTTTASTIDNFPHLDWTTEIDTLHTYSCDAGKIASLTNRPDCPREATLAAVVGCGRTSVDSGAHAALVVAASGHITLEELAREVHPARSVLGLTATKRLFRDGLGKDPTCWLTAARLVADHGGTVPELIQRATSTTLPAVAAVRATNDHPGAILLLMSPPGVIADLHAKLEEPELLGLFASKASSDADDLQTVLLALTLALAARGALHETVGEGVRSQDDHGRAWAGSRRGARHRPDARRPLVEEWVMRRHPDVALIRRIFAGQWPGDHGERVPPPLPAEVWSAYAETFVIWYSSHGGPAGEVTARPGSILVFARDAELAADGLRGVGRREEEAPALTRAEQLQGCLMVLRYGSATMLRSVLREPAVQSRLDADVSDIADQGEAALVDARDRVVAAEHTPQFQVSLLRQIDKDWTSVPLVLARSGGPHWPEILTAHQRAPFSHDALRGLLMNAARNCPEKVAVGLFAQDRPLAAVFAPRSIPLARAAVASGLCGDRTGRVWQGWNTYHDGRTESWKVPRPLIGLDLIDERMLTVDDLVTLTRPAWSLLACAESGRRMYPDAHRDVMAEIRRRLHRGLGDDTDAWITAVTRLSDFPGTFPELLDIVSAGRSRPDNAETDPAQGLAEALDPLPKGGLARLKEHMVDLEGAIRVGREAVEVQPTGHPHRANALGLLGFALVERFERTGYAADQREATRVFAEAARTPTAAVMTRSLASREWARLAASAGEWASAAEGYRLAVGLLPHLAPGELRRDDQEHRLARFPGVASEAAACVLRRDGDAVEAMELLEQGRGVLLAQAMESRGDLTDLREHSARLDQLTDAASEGPLVALNISRFGCDALIVTPGSVASVPLPDVTWEVIRDRVEAFGIALEIIGDLRHDPADRSAATRFISRSVGWLWDAITEPVLSTLGITEPPPRGHPLPRLWWMPTGLLSFLPLHAAGHHDRHSGQTVMDRVVSSYTPTIRALRRARVVRQTRTRGAPHPLVVTMPLTEGQSDLPGARREAEPLVHRFPRTHVLSEQQATRTNVVAALRDSDWAHFACHASAQVDEPSSSHLLLYDGPLSVLDIARLNGSSGYLAYLSACETARGAAELADEAIHISSAFQLAGYPHVIGTLWPIADNIAVHIAHDIYNALTIDPSHASPAHAVHAATQRWRDKFNGNNPILWASHIHTGP